MVNHSDKLETINIDPFKIFEIEYKFDIPNLEELYYEKYKQNVDNQSINLAYLILKNPVQKLFILCKCNGYENPSLDIMSEIFNLIKKKISITNVEHILQSSIQYARTENWELAWKDLQKYQYFKKHLSNV